MRLIEFSILNYRSIVKAQIHISNYNVLVGKNNEGKTNVLTALNVAMNTLLYHCRKRDYWPSRHSIEYDWERDFPIQFKSRKNGLDSIFKLKFRLDKEEQSEFHKETGIRGNEDIPITIKLGKDKNPKISVPKRGTSSYNKKSTQVAEFISNRIAFNYIGAIRTEKLALDALNDVINEELRILNNDEEYQESIKKIYDQEQKVLDKIASNLISPLKVFLPDLKNITIQNSLTEKSRWRYRNNIEVVIDDGIPTSISYKGDGIKSLATLAILKDRRPTSAASIIAIEEPESHLHPGAIRNLVDVIHRISENNQVIITTHNPLFVRQNSLKSNIVVNDGSASPAKTIGDIRAILGVMPEDNLRDSNKVFVVEGDNDKIALNYILSKKSPKLATALRNNTLIIYTLNGTGNLCKVLNDLKNSMCNYFIMLDNDKSGKESINKAKYENLVKDSEYKLTICNGQPESEFEDCVHKEVYQDVLQEKYRVSLNNKNFKSNHKWSIRMKNTFNDQGNLWDQTVEKDVKFLISQAISSCTIDKILIQQKSGFIDSVVTHLEQMIERT